MLYRTLRRAQRANMIGVDVGSDVKISEKRVKDVRREIIDKATRLIPGFMDIAKSLGLDRDDIDGLTGLAGELIYNRPTSSYSSSVRFHGLFKAKGKDARKMKKYNRRAQRYLIMLTSTILRKNSELHLPIYKDMRRVLWMVIEARKQVGLAGNGAGA